DGEGDVDASREARGSPPAEVVTRAEAAGARADDTLEDGPGDRLDRRGPVMGLDAAARGADVGEIALSAPAGGGGRGAPCASWRARVRCASTPTSSMWMPEPLPPPPSPVPLRARPPDVSPTGSVNIAITRSLEPPLGASSAVASPHRLGLRFLASALKIPINP